ncbi:MAG: NAD(P)-binding domain-containing protein [Gammaproteobacteria bacterium]
MLICYFFVKYINQRKNIILDRAARDDGLTDPSSLHPLVNVMRCIGCGACALACPENGVIGVIKGKARLVAPSHCIGHGACREACPVGAITLVFGSERRGVDIPLVNPSFETNVPGIFIAGELGGMGLIRNAIEQGRQAIDSVRRLDGLGKKDRLDVVVVGAGPAGFSASLAAMQHKLRFVTIEQENLGGTVAHYPRGKLVMTAPVKLPLIGKMQFTETTKEALLDFWTVASKRSGLRPNYGERVEGVMQRDGGFEVKTTRSIYPCRAVLLAIGRRGTPRKLDVPGENLPKVVYRVIDPEQYRGQRVLVVGGGDSALEAAVSIADEPDTMVTLSYRSAAFSRAKEKNRRRVDEAVASERLRVLLSSNVKQIGHQTVQIEQQGKLLEIENDCVVVSAGGILPTAFLQEMGITVETKHGTA